MRKFWLAAGCLLVAAAGVAGSLVERVPATAADSSNPLEGSERARRAGAKLYVRECAACHGLNREGTGKAPPLGLAEVYKAPPGVLFWILRNGSLHRGMPSFAHLPEPQRWQIITFLRAQDRSGETHRAAPDSGTWQGEFPRAASGVIDPIPGPCSPFENARVRARLTRQGLRP